MVKHFRQTILKEDESVEYGYEKENLEGLALCFEGKDIAVDRHPASVSDVKGTIDDSKYVDGEGVVIEMSIYDEEYSEMLEESICTVCPIIIKDISTGEVLDVDSTFFAFRGKDMVGEPEVA